METQHVRYFLAICDELSFTRAAQKCGIKQTHVVSGAHIVGLVSLSDLQRLPVRGALFALITGFEITMMSAIRKWYGDEEV